MREMHIETLNASVKILVAGLCMVRTLSTFNPSIMETGTQDVLGPMYAMHLDLTKTTKPTVEQLQVHSNMQGHGGDALSKVYKLNCKT